MPELLTGTVTFLFSDIEGSTRLLRSQGDAWPAILERHRALLRAAFAAEGGQEVGTEGDSFFVAFPTAPGAVAAATVAQQALAAEPWPEEAAVRVRMGLHTGEASFSAKTYVGLHVHRASRIAAVGHGGQVLLSDATRTLVEQALPQGVDLRDLGEHRLKDLEHREHLWQLVIPGLPSDFPPIGSLDATPNNLPTRLTTFLGRHREIGEVGELLRRSRLLTLTGPGGTGKTRLSLEVAARALTHFEAVYFIELASITQPELVTGTIAQALGLPDRGGRSVEERLIDHLGERRVLLVLDNFEQVVEAASDVSSLLAACPNLTVMTSSRSVLRVSGEQEYPVPPLELPDPRNLPPLAQLSQYASVALFVERARAVKPDFAVTNDNAPAVAEICIRLDGLPLALELAAARIRILTPSAMLQRLEHRLGLLSSGSRDLPERQQTLRGAIAWSHDMLEEADRSLFACLAVFVGGAGLEAIEQVCGGAVTGDLLEALDSLVEKSLVRSAQGVAGEPRFGMLETIREFAMEQAVERGVWDDLRARHGSLFASMARDAAARIMGPEKRDVLDRLEQEHDNLRAAFAWAVNTGEAETALRMGSALWRFWQMRGYLLEGLSRVEQALAMPGSTEHPEARADALSAAAGLAYWQAATARSRALYDEEIAARRELGDRRGLAQALYGNSFSWSVLADDDDDIRASHAFITEALEIFREIDDEMGIALCEWALANHSYRTQDPAAGRQHATSALAIFEKLDDRFMVGWANFTIATLELYEDGLSADQASRTAARERLAESLRIFSEAQDVSAYALVLDIMALVASRDGDLDRAARLSGAVDELERSTGTGLNLWNRELLDFDPEPLRTDGRYSAAWAEGAAMTSDEAVEYALSG